MTKKEYVVQLSSTKQIGVHDKLNFLDIVSNTKS